MGDCRELFPALPAGKARRQSRSLEASVAVEPGDKPVSMRILLTAAALIALTGPVHAEDAVAADEGPAAPAAARDGDGIPDQLNAEQRSAYRAIFAAIRGERWADAQLRLAAMPAGP